MSPLIVTVGVNWIYWALCSDSKVIKMMEQLRHFMAQVQKRKHTLPSISKGTEDET